MKTYRIALERTSEVMELAAALLDEGVLPEHLSLIVDESLSERTTGLEPRIAAPTLDDDLKSSHPNRDLRFATTGNPEMERSFLVPLAEPSTLFESSVGAGISTASPNDEVSAIEEMDDASSVAEDLLYPRGDRDRRTDGPRSFSELDAESAAAVMPGSPLGGSTTGVHGQDEGLGVGLFAALIPAVARGVGVVMGDGPLASDLLAECDDPGFDLITFFEARGISGTEAGRFESRLAMGGGILEVAAASGEASARQVQACFDRFGIRDAMPAESI